MAAATTERLRSIDAATLSASSARASPRATSTTSSTVRPSPLTTSVRMADSFPTAHPYWQRAPHPATRPHPGGAPPTPGAPDPPHPQESLTPARRLLPDFPDRRGLGAAGEPRSTATLMKAGVRPGVPGCPPSMIVEFYSLMAQPKVSARPWRPAALTWT